MLDSTKKVATPDLLIAPQLGQVTPSDHLTPNEAANAVESWKQWGRQPIPPNCQTWTAHIIHMIDGKLQPIRVREIPRISDTQYTI